MRDTQLDTISRSLELIVSKLDSILGKLDAATRLRVMGMTEGKSQSDQIWLFSVAGMQPKEIADIVGTSPNTVRVILSNMRKIRRQRRGLRRAT